MQDVRDVKPDRAYRAQLLKRDSRTAGRSLRRETSTSFLTNLTTRLDLPSRALDHVIRFVDAVLPETDVATSFDSSVSESGYPFEISFSGRSPHPDLRVLIEPVAPGGGVVGHYSRALRALSTVISVFDLRCHQVLEVVDRLLPPCEEFRSLNWRSVLWLALRTDGSDATIRLYVNMQWRPPPHRLPRLMAATEHLPLGSERASILGLHTLVQDWAAITGISFDLSAQGLRLARLHLTPERLYAGRLDQLFRCAALSEGLSQTKAFLRCLGMRFLGAPDTMLLSAGMDYQGISSVKLDASYRAAGFDAASRWRGVDAAQAEFGPILAFKKAETLFRSASLNQSIQYCGLTISRDREPYLNVYVTPLNVGEHDASIRSSLLAKRPLEGAATDFILAQQIPSGAFPVEAVGKRSESRLVDQGWPDVYVTSLLSEHLPLPGGCLPPVAERGLVRRLSDFLEHAASHGLYRYLPELPPDADNTAIAYAALLKLGRSPSRSHVRRLLEFAGEGGGFLTFSTDANVHPAVTTNVINALDLARIDWNHDSTIAYLRAWISSSTFGECRWMYSPLLPLYLVSRTAVLDRWFGADWMSQSVNDAVLKRRRGDGCWGKSRPEALETALGVLTLARRGHPVTQPEQVAEFFHATQLRDGGWGWGAIYSDGNGTWFGSRALVTTLVLHALNVLRPPGIPESTRP